MAVPPHPCPAGMKFLHTRQPAAVAHRDLKSANLVRINHSLGWLGAALRTHLCRRSPACYAGTRVTKRHALRRLLHPALTLECVSKLPLLRLAPSPSALCSWWTPAGTSRCLISASREPWTPPRPPAPCWSPTLGEIIWVFFVELVGTLLSKAPCWSPTLGEAVSSCESRVLSGDMLGSARAAA